MVFMIENICYWFARICHNNAIKIQNMTKKECLCCCLCPLMYISTIIFMVLPPPNASPAKAPRSWITKVLITEKVL